MTTPDPRTAAIFESALECIVTFDESGRIQALNAAAERTFDQAREDAIGRDLGVFLPPEVRERLRGGDWPTARLEVEAIRSGGRRIPIELAVTRIDGDPPLYAAFMRDISDRKESEARLHREQERLTEAQRLAHVGSWEWDMRSNETVWSDELHRIFGTSPDTHEASYEGYLACVHPDDRDAVAADVRSGVADRSGFENEKRIVRPDGEIRHIASKVEAILGPGGEPIGLRGTTQDVTELKRAQQLEAELQQAHRLESVGLLAGGVAHDFNNLLAVILNYATFVLEELPRDNEIRPDIEQIRKAAERAADLTRQLLVFSRREVVEPVVVDVSHAVAETEALLRTTLGEDVVLRTRLAEDLSTVEIGSGQLEQVLLNLAFNARDAMPHGGQLTIETRLPDAVDGVRLVVRDTGSGMWPRVVDQAFTPFFTTKPKGEGTGLGLATVYGIVREAGGDVRIDSEPGGGTAVTIDLPRSAEVSPAKRDDAVPPPQNAAGRVVLLAEDEESVRRLAARILSERDYRVVEASDGDEAWRRFREHSSEIDVLLTDVVMPGMPARELVREARMLNPEVGAIYMSGYTGDMLSRRGVLDEGTVVIRKPFDAPTLLAAVAGAGNGDR